MPPFQIHHALTERKGTMWKKGKLLGRMIPRGYHLVWDERLECGILKGYKDDKFSGEPKLINLKECVVKTNPRENIPDATLSAPWLDRSAKKKGFCMNIMSPQGAVIKTLWTHSEMEMEEWVADLRKFAVNSAIENGYEIARDNKNSKLGSGSYSVVYLATDRATGQKWAVKEMQKKSLKKEEVDNLRDEVRISQLVGSHDNIVYMKEFVENPQRYYIVLEYLTGGELFDRIVELMHALAYLHGKRIVHRDLKPGPVFMPFNENFLLANKDEKSPIKIADFGFACNVEGEHSLRGLCGSPGYVAPEIIKEKDGYGLAVDMWSMGVILYILLTGIPPFTGDSDEESFALTLRGHYDKENISEISPAGRDLVARLLTYNPSKRITAAAALESEWLAGGAEDKVLRVQENLRSWRARMRFKKAIIATVATTRLHAIMRRAAARPDATPVDE